MFALALRLIEHETEQEAFDQLYTRYRGLAFWVAKGYHLSDSDAEDAVQDAFFALAESFSKYPGMSICCGQTSLQEPHAMQSQGFLPFSTPPIAMLVYHARPSGLNVI